MSPSRQQDLELLHEWITDKSSRGAIAVIAHRNGDMDTAASAVGMATAVGVSAKACGVHLCPLARETLDKEEFEFMFLDGDTPKWPTTLAGIIAVDAGAESQLGLSLPAGVPKCIIDHHSSSDWSIMSADLALNWKVGATTQLVKAYIDNYNPAALNAGIARILLAGIITDTGRFRHGDVACLEDAAQLVNSNRLDLREIVEFIECRRTSTAERIAVLKAIQRLRFERISELLVVDCRASMHESIACTALISAGADVALVTSIRGDEIRITGRAIDSSIRDGIDLGVLMTELKSRFGGEGGGHAGAAGWQGEAESVELLSACHHLLREQL